MTACATGGNAIGDAARITQRGEAVAILAGGSEAAITPLSMAGFCAMRAMSTGNDAPQKAVRPFDAQRDGFVMGEGAGIVLLEELEHARRREARIYAELVGYYLPLRMARRSFMSKNRCNESVGDGAKSKCR